ncbi:sieve element occlusion [Artemisia annua]|uniref:Sieve element occlusion n=1 Tax=Artemisia annua TaxID=35608 RepID=A0A2U1MFE9_ARTAN|nr:sieve element occlusion [Artemisia annua]
MQPQQPQPQQQQLVKKERSSSDDSAMLKQAFATHSPDDVRNMDLEPILRVIEKTLLHAIPASLDGVNDGTHDGHVEALAGEEKAAIAGFDGVDGIPDSLAHEIHKISCEFSCKCSGGDARASTIAILTMLSGYTWEAKMVISLGALSVNVGEFWLVAQLIATNPLAESVALLKRLPNIIEHYKSLEPKFKPFNDLIKAMLEVTKCIIELKKLRPQYLQYDEPTKSTVLTHVPTAAYSCIISMVACVTQLTSLLGKNYKYIATSEAWVPLDLADKIKSLVNVYTDIAEKEKRDFIEIEKIFYRPQGILESINALFGANPLLNCSSKNMVNVNVLSEKNVLLLISDLDISHEKVKFLNEIYSRKQANHQYEVIWVPVVDDLEMSNDSQRKFEHLQSMMKWHVLQNPESLKPAVIRYLKQEWHFETKPILVVLDQQGQLASPNALHMFWIWGNTAYPFTREREPDLWKTESWTQSWTQSWTLELWVDSNDLKKWIAEKKNICLYGGDNVWWIREFIKLAARVAQVADIKLQMVYVGKSGTKERISKITAKLEKISETISEKKVSYSYTDPTKVCNIWTRLESMLYLKLQHKKSYKTDPIMKEVMTMMSFDGSNQGWAFICDGSSEMARANADLASQSFEEYRNWDVKKKQIGFVPALREYLTKLHKSEHCNRLILPWNSGGIPEVVECSECGRKMEKFFMFRCCTD